MRYDKISLSFVTVQFTFMCKTNKGVIKMATRVYKFQVALKTCEEHRNKEVSCFCETCKTFICTTCAKTTHHGHEWDFIPLVAKICRQETPLLCRKINQENMPQYREKIRIIDGNISDEEKACDEDVKKLEERRTAMIDAVDQIIEEQKRKRVEIKKRESEKLIEQRLHLVTKIEYLDKMTSSLDSNISAYTDFDVIEMKQGMLTALREVESVNVNFAATEMTFVQGEIDHGLMKKMVGTKEEKATAKVNDTVSVEQVKIIKQFDKRILVIAPISATQAWIGVEDSHKITKLSLSLHNTETLDFKRYNDCITQSNDDFIVAKYTEQAIHCVTSSGVEDVIASTKPLHPSRIRKTQTDDILVSLRDDGHLYKLQPSSRRLVQRMTLTGKIIHTYEFRVDGATRLFTLPVRTTENGNSDICVINRTSSRTGELIVLHGDGRVRFTYCGQGHSEFDPRDIACDSIRRIIVLDCNKTNSLHLLSPDGKFLRYVLTDMFDSFPYVMTLYQGNLWIGFGKGAVNVYKYIDSK